MTEQYKINLKGLSKIQLDDFIRSRQWESYRARQIFHWLYQKNVASFAEMTTLKKSIRDNLAATAEINCLRLVKMVVSQQDTAHKFLFVTSDGQWIESVYMEDANRRTICVSSQVGCVLHCDFCATGRMGFKRNLTAGEIVDQVLWIERSVGKEATNVVVMGMGEPFLNYDAVIQAAGLIADPEGIAIGKRKITISTSGIVPGIKRFSAERQRFKLAVSLNATTDRVRQRIMPINQKYPLAELLAAVKEYTEHSPYRVTFEYILMAGINDSLADAQRLRKLLQAISCKINLIPYNATDLPYRAPTEEQVQRFQAALATFSALVTVRKSQGWDIQAACGQLYAEMAQQCQPV